MRILVTGVAGFAGYRIACHLHQKGHIVTGLVRTKQEECYPFPVIVHDLSMPLQCKFIFDAVIHSAGGHPGNTTIQLKHDNIDSMEHLVDYAERMRVPRIIYLSSISVYGDIHDSVVDENTSVINPNAYGLSKYIAERILIESSVQGICLRLPGIFGENSYRGWLSSVLKNVSDGKEITIFSPNFLTNAFLFIDDLVSFVDILLEKECEEEIFVLGTKEKLTIKDCVDLVKKEVHSESIVHIGKAEKLPFSLNIQKAMKFGFLPTQPKRFIVQTAASFYRSRNEALS